MSAIGSQIKNLRNRVKDGINKCDLGTLVEIAKILRLKISRDILKRVEQES